MRGFVVVAALLLPLAGCDEAPTGYAQPGYPPGYGYPPPAYGPPAYGPPGYGPPGAYDQYGNVYPGYQENGGDPSLLVEGAAVPLVLFGGGWGYWDGRHEWHRAPDAVSRHLEEQRASGGGFHHDRDGFGQPRPEGRPGPGGWGGRGQFPRPAEQGRPAAVPAGAGRPAAVPAGAARPTAAASASHPGRDQGHNCPPGQRC